MRSLVLCKILNRSGHNAFGLSNRVPLTTWTTLQRKADSCKPCPGSRSESESPQPPKETKESKVPDFSQRDVFCMELNTTKSCAAIPYTSPNAPISAGGDWEGPCLMDSFPEPQGCYEDYYKKFHRQRMTLVAGGVGIFVMSLLALFSCDHMVRRN